MGSVHSTLSPSLPWQTKLKIFLLDVLTDAVCRDNGTVNRRLAAVGNIRSPANHTPTRGTRSTDFTVDRSRHLWFRLFLPAVVTSPLPVIIFFHGGGFAFLSAATREYDAVCRRFCRQLSVAVISVNYRLSPEHRYPAQYEDGLSVLRFLDASEPVKNPLVDEFFKTFDLSNCFLVGDSAGANIAHHVARRWVDGGGGVNVSLRGIVAIQPFYGGEERTGSELRMPRGPVVTVGRTDWLWKAFLPEGATRGHVAVDPWLVCEGLGEEFPAVMVVVGGFDPLQDWQRKYYQSLKKKERKVEIVEYPEAIHAFYVFPELKDSKLLIEDMRGFILRQTRKTKFVS